MKKIEAIIRKEKFEEVKKALFDVDIEFFTYWDATGIGKQKERVVFRSQSVKTDQIQRRQLSIVVRDQNVEKTVNAIMKAAWTGEIGDGKIFVSNIEQAYRIRTGESGPESLYVKEAEALA
ncbi:MAG: P-II family nitrogen regulator [Bacteroidota bacterium]|nr:P-II family nitrogen regulator [Bacteroidota bacterium]MDP4226808.1 P-II family nitrogen regulator [Bacteroidota bacterium]MDP4274466.1 P-II family nitrogen regulator [Bacteroidota bacterium]